jgi:hypothetical protein
MWLPVLQSTNLSRHAEDCAQSHSFLVTPCCIDTAEVSLRRDAFLAMIRRLSSLPPIAMKASAHAFPAAAQDVDAGSDGGGSRSAAVAACGNVETDAAGTRMAAGQRKIPLVY